MACSDVLIDSWRGGVLWVLSSLRAQWSKTRGIQHRIEQSFDSISSNQHKEVDIYLFVQKDLFLQDS